MKPERYSMQEILLMINDSLTAIQQQISSIEERIAGLEQRVAGLEKRMTALEERMTAFEARVETRFDYHETWLNRIEKNMTTKDQVKSLCIILKNKEVITGYEAAHVAASA